MTWIDNIKEKVKRKVPNLANENDLLEDLIDDAFHEIIDYANADRYNTAWDRILVECVVIKYNTIGNEGVISRSGNGISDNFGTAVRTSEVIAKSIPQYLKPCGYRFSVSRYNYPV